MKIVNTKGLKQANKWMLQILYICDQIGTWEQQASAVAKHNKITILVISLALVNDKPLFTEKATITNRSGYQRQSKLLLLVSPHTDTQLISKSPTPA